ncbi:paraquat-inducible protein A [Allohahella marinimesophila]|uniref:Paraquat-inducible protein A n=1 Tax=Allohahella marinimesophila TaxID=1054972 RepID=A0ABP7NKD5_9GAMM
MALTIAATIMFIPANALPIMTVSYFGKGAPDTILSGVILLLQHGAWPIAAIVFFASFIVPLGKILGLFYLLYRVRGQGSDSAHGKQLKLYRVIDFFGRWSMLDVFVVALLVALVQLGQIATIEAGSGATAFAAMVVLTMFAAGSFDPRLLWDRTNREY